MHGALHRSGCDLDEGLSEVVIGDDLMHRAEAFDGVDLTITCLSSLLPDLDDDLAIFKRDDETADAGISFGGEGVFSDGGHD